MCQPKKEGGTQMDIMQFEFSDTIAGYVTNFDPKARVFNLKTVDDREFSVKLTHNTYARGPRNLDEPWCDYTAKIDSLLVKGQYLFTIGIFYPQKGKHVFEAKVFVFPGEGVGKYEFEAPTWWINQARSIADFFIRAQFGGADKIDYRNYRTSIYRQLD